MPRDVLRADRPEAMLIATLRAGDLPEPLEYDNQRFLWTIEDLPEEGVAHCEVRLTKSGESFDPDKPKSKSQRKRAKELLAARLRLDDGV